MKIDQVQKGQVEIPDTEVDIQKQKVATEQVAVSDVLCFNNIFIISIPIAIFMFIVLKGPQKQSILLIFVRRTVSQTTNFTESNILGRVARAVHVT